MVTECSIPEEIKRITLVGFKNDSAGISLAVARALQGRLFAVRLNTDADLRDISVITHLFFPPRPDVVIGGEKISERNE